MSTSLAPTSGNRCAVRNDIDDVDIDLGRASVRELLAARALTDDQLWHLRGWPAADQDAARARAYLLSLREHIDRELLARRERDRACGVQWGRSAR